MNLRRYKKDDAVEILNWIKNAYQFYNESWDCAEMLLDR